MLNSMTGYGEAQGETDGINYAVEVKAVNNRYLKTIVKLPDILAFLEENIERLLRDNLARGTVNYVLRCKDVSANTLFDIDESALQVIVEKLGRIKSSAEMAKSIDIGSLLNLPGIIRPMQPDEDTAGRMKLAILKTSEEAIDRLKEMRAAEGAALEADLNEHCSQIQESLGYIRRRSGVVVQEYARKLKKRVDDLLAHAELKLDEEALAREVAILADRSDISEEIARLDSHLQQFATACGGDDQAGRRLDFISQEMLREANTIASKSSDAEITRTVVDMKCRVDRIKEQVQNIE
jgi:uncharacterized protein (TIGR00255 family)